MYIYTQLIVTSNVNKLAIIIKYGKNAYRTCHKQADTFSKNQNKAMIPLTLRVFFACLFVCFTFLQFLSPFPFLPLADDVVSIFGPPKKLSKHSINFFDLYLRTPSPKTSSSVIVTAHPGLMGFFFFFLLALIPPSSRRLTGL